MCESIVNYLFKVEKEAARSRIWDAKDRACILNLLLEVLSFYSELKFQAVLLLSAHFLRHHEDGKLLLSYDIRRESTFAGLRNLGNTCYLNSVVQQLYMVDGFRESVLGPVPDTKEEAATHRLYLEFRRLFCRLNSSILQTIAPASFAQSFLMFDNQPINYNQQQDAPEFFSLLMDQVDRFLGAGQTPNFLQQTFGGKLTCKISSLEEEFPFENEIEEPFIMLSLDIKHNRTLQDALAYYMRGEILDKENKCFLERYQRRVTLVKKYQLKALPECLVLTLNRFEFDRGTMMRKKLNNHFEFPEKFDFGFLEEEEADRLRELGQYRLTGVVVHSGTADAGHYWSYVFREGKWLEFNDANVGVKSEGAEGLREEWFGRTTIEHGFTELNFEREQYSKSAYVLFYTRADVMDKRMEPVQQAMAADLREWIEQDDEKVIASKYFNDSAFSLFVHELSKSLTEEKAKAWKQSIEALPPADKKQVKEFLKAKMRTLYFMTYGDEFLGHRQDHLIIGPNDLDISFEPRPAEMPLDVSTHNLNESIGSRILDDSLVKGGIDLDNSIKSDNEGEGIQEIIGELTKIPPKSQQNQP